MNPPAGEHQPSLWGMRHRGLSPLPLVEMESGCCPVPGSLCVPWVGDTEPGNPVETVGASEQAGAENTPKNKEPADQLPTQHHYPLANNMM